MNERVREVAIAANNIAIRTDAMRLLNLVRIACIKCLPCNWGLEGKSLKAGNDVPVSGSEGVRGNCHVASHATDLVSGGLVD